jgi:hypothetical protein
MSPGSSPHQARHVPQSCAFVRQTLHLPRVDARAQVLILMRSAIPGPCASTMAAVIVGLYQSICGRARRSLEWTDQDSRGGYASIVFP